MIAERLAIQFMIGQAVLFAAETAIFHHIGSEWSVTQLALLRGIGGVLLAVALGRHAGIAVVRTRQLHLQLLRGAASAMYLWVMIYSFEQLPFADATAISYTQPAYIILFSASILGESIVWSTCGAAFLAVVGALLISKPALAGWSGAHLLVLLGTSLNAVAFVLNRYLQQEDSEATTLFYANFVCVIANVPFVESVSLTPVSYLWPACILAFGPIGMYLGIVASKYASASALAPYTLLRLVVAIFGGIMIFHELPDILSICGSVLVLTACILSNYRGTLGVQALRNYMLFRGQKAELAVER